MVTFNFDVTLYSEIFHITMSRKKIPSEPTEEELQVFELMRQAREDRKLHIINAFMQYYEFYWIELEMTEEEFQDALDNNIHLLYLACDGVLKRNAHKEQMSELRAYLDDAPI